MNLKDCKIIDLPTFEDERGALTLVDRGTAEQKLPFVPTRWFWIHGLSSDSVRGEHAHRTCWEIVTAVSGNFHLTLHDGLQESTFVLDSPSKGVVIPPMVWCRLSNFTPGTVCLTMASHDYDPEGYINDFRLFLNETHNG